MNGKNEKSILTDRINEDLSEQNFEDLFRTILVAEKYGVSKLLVRNACIRTGRYFLSANNFDDAIIVLNKARIRNSKSNSILQLFLNAVQAFMKENEEKFLQDDLIEFKQAIVPILEFHKSRYSEQLPVINPVESSFKKINLIVEKTTKDAPEYELTYRIRRIVNALYTDLSPDQIKESFDKLIKGEIKSLHGEKINGQNKEE